MCALLIRKKFIIGGISWSWSEIDGNVALVTVVARGKVLSFDTGVLWYGIFFMVCFHVNVWCKFVVD